MRKSETRGIACRLLLALLMLATSATVLRAQSITQTVHSTMAAPSDDLRTYLIAGESSIEFNFTFDKPVADVSEAYWTIDGQRIDMTVSIEDGMASFSSATFTASGPTSFQVEANLVYTPAPTEEDPEPAVSTLVATGTTVIVYDRPSASYSFPAATSFYEGTPLTYSVDVAGGNPDGWNYTFHNVNSSNGSTASVVATTALNTAPPSVDVVNRTPIGTDTWFSETYTFPITVFTTPDITFNAPAATEYISGNTVLLSVTPQGGDPNAWSYEWTVNGVKNSEAGATLNYVTTNTGSQAIETTIEVTATNAPADIDEPRTFKRSFTFTTYPTPSFSGLAPHPTAAFSGDPVDVTFSVSGGNPDGWILNEKENGVLISSESITAGRQITINLGTDNVTSQSASTYTFEVVNTYGDQTFTASEETTITYYPTPTAVIATTPDRSSFFSGTRIGPYVNTTGGERSAWTYAWDMDGVALGTSYNNPVTLVNDGTTPKNVTISCTATCAPVGIATPAVFPLSMTFAVYPEPSVGEITLPNTAYFSGAELTFAPAIAGGNDEGWTFEWYDNGTKLGENGATLTYTAINNSGTAATHTIRLVAVNTLETATKDFEHQFTFQVYPAPSASFTAPEHDQFFNGNDATLTVNPVGGDASAWVYTWTVNGTPVSTNGASLNHTFVNTGNAAVTTTIACTATNAPAGIGEAYSQSWSYTATVYPSAELQSLTLPYSAVFSGTEVPLTATVSGGNPDGWTYEWYDNDVKLETTTAQYTFTAPVVTSAQVHKLNVRATNTIASGTQSYSSDVSITVYPTSDANMTVPGPDQFFNGDAYTFSITTQGGDAAAWTYAWTVDGSPVASNGATLNHTFVNTGSSAVTTTITCTATNAPAGINEPQTKTMTYATTVYPKAALQAMTLPYSAIFSGTEVPLTATVSGGNPDGWTYEWYDNDVKLEATTAQYTFTAPVVTAAQTHKLTVRATNTIASGTQSYSSDVTITVYPTSDANMSVPSTDQFYNGETFTFGISTQGGDAAAWTYVWTVDGAPVASNGASLNHTFVNTGSAAVATTITCTATNAPTGINAPQTKTMSFSGTVYPAPGLQPLTLPYSAVFSGTAVPLTAIAVGGNPTGWTYEWYDNDTKLDNTTSQYTFTAPIVATPHVHKLTVYATNTIDGSTETYNSSIDITVYPPRTASLILPAKTEWFSDRTFDLAWNINGGSAADRSYSWRLTAPEQTELGTGHDLTFSTLNTGTEPIQYTLVAEVTDAPVGINQPAVTTETFSFTVYPLPRITSFTADKSVVFNGAQVHFTAVVVGGNSSNLSYTWTCDGTTLLGRTESTMAITETNTADRMLTRVYDVIVSTTVADETVTVSSELTVDAWPSAAATLVSPERKEYYAGEGVPFSVDITGGDPSAWTYEWVNISSTDREVTVIAENNTDEPRMQSVNVQAVNAPTGIDEPYTIQLSDAFTVYSEPRIFNNVQSSRAIFSGELVTVGIIPIGGNESGWNFKWSINGEETPYNARTIEIPLTTEQNTVETFTFDLVATNAIEGQTRTFEYSYTVDVWPVATAEFITPEGTEWLWGQSLSFNVSTDGGDSSAWTYQWTYDGTPMSTSGAVLDFLVQDVAEGGQQHTIATTATNTPDGINAPYVFTQAYTFTAYPRPAIATEPDMVDRTVFSGTPVTMTITPSGGRPDGWTYSWTRDGEAFSGDGTSITDTPVTYDIEGHTYTYTVHAVNSMAPDQTLNLSFHVTVWPQPIVNLPVTLPSNYASGDDVSLAVIRSGGDPSAWTFEWSHDGETVSGTNASFSTRAENYTQESAQNTITVKATNAPIGIDVPFSETHTYEYTVWPRPTSVNMTRDYRIVHSGRNLQFGADLIGGQTDAWTCEWTFNGEAIDNDNQSYYNTTFYNTGTTMRTDILTLTVTNRIDGTVSYTQTYTYTVDVYPQPTVTVPATSFEAYYDEIIRLAVEPLYGYPQGWTFVWSVDAGNSAAIDYSVPASDADDSFNTVTLTVTNSYEDETWFSQEYAFTIHGWSRGTISGQTVLDADYNGTLTADLTTSQKGGYTDGWSYSWYLNGEFLNSGLPYLTVTEANYGSAVENLTWTLVATNTLNGTVGSQTTIPFSTRLWPVITAPENFTVSPLNALTGETVTLSVPAPATGGYNNAWTYSWTADGTTIGVNSPVVYYTAQADGSGHAFTDITLGLHLTNAGPAAENWFDRTYPTQSLRVYNRPEAPTSLVRKGNGTTCTLIAMSALTDTQLADEEYEFVFGYTSAAGVDTEMPATVNRFCRFASDVYNNSSNDFWVYTRWTYANGATVTSQRRHLSGALDDFNGSNFDSTGRSEEGGIAGALVSDDDIYITTKGFKLKLSEPAEVTVRILTAAGAAVFTGEYPEVTTVYENFGVQRLDPGVYIVNIHAGDKVITKKVALK